MRRTGAKKHIFLRGYVLKNWGPNPEPSTLNPPAMVRPPVHGHDEAIKPSTQPHFTIPVSVMPAIPCIPFKLKGRWSTNIYESSELRLVANAAEGLPGCYEFVLHDEKAALGGDCTVDMRVSIAPHSDTASLAVSIDSFQVNNKNVQAGGPWSIENGIFELRLDSLEYPAFWMELSFAIPISNCLGTAEHPTAP